MIWRSMSGWPANFKTTPDDWRKHSPFKSSWDRTLDELYREIIRSGGIEADAVMEVDIPERYWSRASGRPKADAVQRSPGVVLRFEVPQGDPDLREFPCDTYLDWQDNVRAIAKTLEALRAVERYGAARGRQYEGFKALPARGVTTMTTEGALSVVERWSKYSRREWKLDHAVRVARANAHPDTSGGSHEAFILVQEAERVLTAAGEL
jgi:hypothetical protein